MSQSLEPYTPKIDPAAIEQALTVGDVSKMDAHTRVQFYQALCASCGLNVLTRPFILLKTQSGELHWYLTAAGADQLRKLHKVSTKIVSRERSDDQLYTVTVQVTAPDNRQEESQGIVYVGGLKGQELGNALMKASSKALRRATLAICGLGLTMADEESGQAVPFDPQTGDVQMPPPRSEAATLLHAVGQWFRQQPKAVREKVAQAVWHCTLAEMPHLGVDDLAAGWHVIDEGRAPLDWASATLAADVAQWKAQHAAQAALDVFDWADGENDHGRLSHDA